MNIYFEEKFMQRFNIIIENVINILETSAVERTKLTDVDPTHYRIASQAQRKKKTGDNGGELIPIGTKDKGSARVISKFDQPSIALHRGRLEGRAERVRGAVARMQERGPLDPISHKRATGLLQSLGYKGKDVLAPTGKEQPTLPDIADPLELVNPEVRVSLLGKTRLSGAENADRARAERNAGLSVQRRLKAEAEKNS